MTDQDSSQRPYLVRAMHEWMSDNGKTPHVVLDATMPGVLVPPQHVKDGKITLNCSLNATRNLIIGNEQIEFETRFGGQSQVVFAPMEAVLGIYARESGEGMLFTEPHDDAEDGTDGDQPPDPPEPGPAGPPNLRVVK